MIFSRCELYRKVIETAGYSTVTIVFLYAAVSKLVDPEAFTEAIERYQLLPRELCVLIALYLPCLEIVLALVVWTNRLQRPALLVCATLSVCFCFIIASALVRNLNIDCGCFGASATVAHDNLGFSLLRAISLVFLTTWLYFAASTRRQPRGNI